MNEVWVGCVVEGEGEVQAVPHLIRRVAARVDPGLTVHVPHPVRIKRNRIAQRFDDLQRGIGLAGRLVRPPGAVLVLLDADKDCPAQLGPELLRQATADRGGMGLSVVLAKREYEAWFLAAAASLRGKRGLADSLEPPPDPEAVQDAKGWPRARMPKNRKYSPTVDQAALTQLFDLELARQRSDSFSKCYREIERLLRSLLPPPPPPEPDAANGPAAAG